MRKGLRRILITAGPTRERIDPIRFISNFSTGLMGYEIARQAQTRGYKVTLISGPTNLTPPKGVNLIHVESGRQMSHKVKDILKKSDCLFMTSAVCDWRPLRPRQSKIKRSAGIKKLALAENPDILYEAGKNKDGRILIGFALESDKVVKNAKEKLLKKNLDIIVANKISKKTSPFGDGLTDVLVIDKTGNHKWLRHLTKKSVAGYLIDKVEKMWEG